MQSSDGKCVQKVCNAIRFFGLVLRDTRLVCNGNQSNITELHRGRTTKRDERDVSTVNSEKRLRIDAVRRELNYFWRVA